ncbi:MAG: RlpA-like double-psi beta-barrel domain-containing protein [Patescibacteria group bacterium]
MNKKTIFNALLTAVFLLAGVLGNFSGEAAKGAGGIFKINLDLKTIEKGYTVSDPDGRLKLSLVPGILSGDTGVEIQELDEKFSYPWELEKISPVMQFEFNNKSAYDNHKPFYIQFSYNKDDSGLKQVFFYDKGAAAWRALPTWDFPDQKFVRSLIHLPFARIAVFSNPNILTKGKASWYSYKKGMFAASPDFPIGSKLRVHVSGAKTDKYVDVTVNDYGPDRKTHPDRVVDLTKEAFKKIASLSDGTATVYVEPLVITGSLKLKLAEYEKGARFAPDLNFRASIVMNENTGKILEAVNATTTLPLASLTKIIAVKVFLEAHPTTTEIAAYSMKDEEYNYLYCKPWESGKLKLEEGETLTVKDLIYSSLTGSTNNTVETLVRVSGLTRDGFIKRMNDLAEFYGAESTFFIEPTGLSPKNVSSAKDYAIITKEVLREPIIREASVSKVYKFKTYKKDGKEISHSINNTNTLVRQGKYEFTGSKTGYLNEALYCLMSRVKAANGENLIIVTLGAKSRDESFKKTEELIQYSLIALEKNSATDKLALSE